MVFVDLHSCTCQATSPWNVLFAKVTEPWLLQMVGASLSAARHNPAVYKSMLVCQPTRLADSAVIAIVFCTVGHHH